MTNIPGGFAYIQQESVAFNNPVSESSMTSIGAAVNGLLSVFLPVGSTIQSMLTETQFQSELGSPSPATWVLADGRSVVGSRYSTITGNSTIPDLRGIMTRGKNNGRVDGNQNPEGDLALGTFSTDRFSAHNHGGGDHTHTLNQTPHSHNFSQGSFGSDNSPSTPAYGTNGAGTVGVHFTSIDSIGIAAANSGVITATQGSFDTAPKTVTVNTFIRIN